MEEYITPPEHIHFMAKKLFGAGGRILDGSIACIAPGGGGPQEPHTHPGKSHLFVVLQGCARIRLENTDILLHPEESYLVPGEKLHAVWNDTHEETVMLGISVTSSSE